HQQPPRPARPHRRTRRLPPGRPRRHRPDDRPRPPQDGDHVNADTELTLDGWAPGPGILASEMALVGAAIQRREALEEAAELVTPADLYSVAASVYAAALAVLERGDPIEPAVVLDELHARGDVERVGGGPYLGKLIEHACP